MVYYIYITLDFKVNMFGNKVEIASFLVRAPTAWIASSSSFSSISTVVFRITISICHINNTAIVSIRKYGSQGYNNMDSTLKLLINCEIAGNPKDSYFRDLSHRPASFIGEIQPEEMILLNSFRMLDNKSQKGIYIKIMNLLRDIEQDKQTKKINKKRFLKKLHKRAGKSCISGLIIFPSGGVSLNLVMRYRVVASSIFILLSFISVIEHHLDLWFSKLPVWIEDHENHALVYLDYENKHEIALENLTTQLSHMDPVCSIFVGGSISRGEYRWFLA